MYDGSEVFAPDNKICDVYGAADKGQHLACVHHKHVDFADDLWPRSGQHEYPYLADVFRRTEHETRDDDDGHQTCDV